MNEVFIVKNQTVSTIELSDFGVLILPDTSVELGKFDDALFSDQLQGFLQNGSLVRLVNGLPVPFANANSILYMFDVSANDASINILQAKDAFQDVSLNNIWIKFGSVDTSLLNLGIKDANQDVSLNNIWTKLGSVDTSLLNLGIKNANQDVSINDLRIYVDGSLVNIRNTNIIQDASIVRIDGSIADLYNTKVDRAGDTMTGKLTVPELDVTGDVSLSQKVHLTEYNNTSIELGDLWVDSSGCLNFAYEVTSLCASSFILQNRLLRTSNDWVNFPDTSTLDDGDRILIEDAQDGYAKKWISKQAFAEGITGGFGDWAAYSQNINTLTTTSAVYQTAHTLTTDASGPESTYRIGFSFQATHSNNSKQMEVRVQVDNAITIEENIIVPPVGGVYQNIAGFSHVDLSTGAHTIEIDYRRVQTPGSASITDMRLEFWQARSGA